MIYKEKLIRNENKLKSKRLNKKLFILLAFTIFYILINFIFVNSTPFQMEWGNISIPPETWVKVNMTNIYEKPIVVATPVYSVTTNNNGISSWITNITTDSFMIRVSDENLAAADNILINYLIVEEGNWTIPNSTIKIEAGEISTYKVGSQSAGWNCPSNGETISFKTTFNSNPLVLSTRASNNNPNVWATTFQHDPAGASTPVGTSQMCIGLSQSRAISPGTIVYNETINWIAIDEGFGYINGIEYEILWNLQDTGDSGGNWINGYADPKPFYQSWAHSWTNSPMIIIAGETTVSGGDGGWPIIYDLGNKTHIRIFVDEANERSHGGSESGGGFAFSSSGDYGNFPPQNFFINFTKSIIYINQNNTINATVYDVNGNYTVSKVISTIKTPNSTLINISLKQLLLNLTLNSSDLENGTKNYTAITGGDIIGESGVINLSNRTSKLITFTQNYSQTPVIIAVPITQNNDDSYPIPTIHSINTTHANISLCRDNGATTCDNNYLPETVAYAVFDVNKTKNLSWIDVGWVNATTDGLGTAFTFNKTFSNAPYVWAQAQSYNINSVVPNGISATSWLSAITTTGGNLHGCDHPGTANACGGTATETFGYVAIDVLNNNIKDFSYGTNSIRHSAWTKVLFGRNYNNPNIFVIVNSDNGNQDPKYPWAKNLISTESEIRYCEQDGTNYCDTHAGEDTRWFAIEKGPIATGYGGDDIEKNLTINIYQDAYSNITRNISKIKIYLNITKYNNSGSISRGNNNPDLEIELKDFNDNWVKIGKLNITGPGMYSINTSNPDIFKAFEQKSKRDVKVNGINFDYFSSTSIDYIFWNVTKVEVDYIYYTSNWKANFTNTSICGIYNLTDLYSFDNKNLNHTNYTNISFEIPCNPIVTLIKPINYTKLITNRTINLTWYVESGYSNLSCDLYINSILNRTINCSSFVNNSFIINLDSGLYNWTINVTDPINLSNKPTEEFFYNIINYSSKITKRIRFENTNIYRIYLDVENLLNFNRSYNLIDFVDRRYNFGSFSKIYDWSELINGTIYNGTNLGWNLSIINNSKEKINYSITNNVNDYYLLDEFIVGLE